MKTTNTDVTVVGSSFELLSDNNSDKEF